MASVTDSALVASEVLSDLIISERACCATQLDDPERAALLHGGADALLAASEDQWEPLEAEIRQRDQAALRDRHGAEFDSLYLEGLAMPHIEVIKLALSVH